MECLTHCYRGLYICIVDAIASLTRLTQEASSPHPVITKILPQDQIASKLDLDHGIWVSSGVLDLLDRIKGNE